MFDFLKKNVDADNVNIERRIVFHDTTRAYSMDIGGLYCVTDMKIYQLYPTDEYEIAKEKYTVDKCDSDIPKNYIYKKKYRISEGSYYNILAKYLKDI